jgi:VWFA-related protein
MRAFVAVTDPSGAMIKTLREGDFVASETVRGQSAPVENLRFANRSELNLPLAIMFVVDTSGSMQPAIEQEKEAIRQFVAQLKPEDRVGLVTFSDTAATEVSLTSDHQQLLSAVESLQPEYQTALWDGIYTGMQELLADPETGRKAMIVLSDGVDNRSVESTDTIMQGYDEQARSQNKGFSIFTLGLGMDLDRQGLSQIADQTSGLYIESPTPADLAGVYESILSQIQGEYLLEYESPGESAQGEIIDLEVGVPTIGPTAQGKYTYRSPGLSKALARAIWPGLIAISILTIILIVATIYKLTRRAWVTVMITALEGREHTLRGGSAEIGSSEAADIRVTRDPAVLPHHATLRETSDGFVLQSVDPDAPIISGDRMLARKLLRSGDKFILGTTTFTFRERIDRPGAELLEAAGVQREELAPLTAAGQADAAALPATARARPSALVGIAGPYAGQRFELRDGANVVGRTEGDIVLGNDTQVSRRHCTIDLGASAASISDVGSTNGTFVNGARLAVNTPQLGYAGDQVQIGATSFQLE